MQADVWKMKQGDTTPSRVIALQYDNGNPIVLTGTTVRFIMKSASGSVVANRLVAVTDALNGEVTIDWQAGETASAGVFLIEFEVTFTDTGKVMTVPHDSYQTLEILGTLA